LATILGSQKKTAVHQVPDNPRIAFYTHDTFGLGHVKRSIRIMSGIARKRPDAALLLITGCPALHSLQALPPNADCVKIPTIVKTGAAGSRPPHLNIPLNQVTSMRTRITMEALAAFSPDVLVVDNFPLGSRKELLPVLEALKPQPTKTILGLRDILDAPDAVQSDWQRQGIYEVLDRYYDTILIYGADSVFDAVVGYAIPENTAGKIKYCGYITDTDTPVAGAKKTREQMGISGGFILVSGGGGGDAFPLLNTFIKAVPHLPPMYFLLVLGPMMGMRDQKEIIRKASCYPNIILKHAVPDLRPYIKAADVFVSMGGYNTAGEILAYRPKAVMIPRTWQYGEHLKRDTALKEGEQMLRAAALDQSGYVKMIAPEKLTFKNMAQNIIELLNTRKKRPVKKIDINGIEKAVDEILQSTGLPAEQRT
jgi:predicted glycosyltransferase